MECNYCNKENCKEDKVYLKKYCWYHLSKKAKKKYGELLLEALTINRNVECQNFNGIQINGIIYPEFVNFRDCTFIGAELEDVSFQRADFKGVKFTKAIVKDCHLEFSDFRGTNTYLDYADMRESHFDGALFQNTICTGTDFRDAIFFDVDMVGAMMKNTILYSSRFNNTRLRKESFCNYENLPESQIKIKDENFNVKNENVPSPLEATIVYSVLKNNFKSIGSFDDERWAYKKERSAEHIRLFKFFTTYKRQYDKIAIERWAEEDIDKIFESRPKAFLSWTWLNVERVFGYGISAIPLLFISVFIILIFSFLYYYFGISNQINNNYFDSLFFSIKTFTTNSDNSNLVSITKIFSSIETLTGFIIMALAISVLAKNIFRS